MSKITKPACCALTILNECSVNQNLLLFKEFQGALGDGKKEEEEKYGVGTKLMQYQYIPSGFGKKCLK